MRQSMLVSSQSSLSSKDLSLADVMTTLNEMNRKLDDMREDLSRLRKDHNTLHGLVNSLKSEALLSTVCNVLTGAYHSLLICSAANSLALSVDRALAVFEPVRYRVLAQKGKKLTIVVLTPWALAGLCLLTVPLTWHFYGNALQAHFTCWPLLAVKKEFLFLQGAVLLVCVLGITLAHFSLLYKLTRRAMLVVPMFGTRLSETTAVERRQTRRSVRHAGSQACTVALVYLAMAPYVMWLADGSISLRLSKACEGHHLLLSLIPLVGTIINSLLTLWRFRDRPSSSTNTTQNCREMEPAPRSNTPSSSWKPHPDVPHPTETEEEQTKQESESEWHPSCSEAQVEKKSGPADAEDEDTCGQSEGSDNSIWWPPEDEHYNDNCRDDPCLLTMTVVTSTTKDRRTGGKVE
ncbi:hypothetical protein ACOMHN_044071 [Nucella lapillus]